MKEASRVERPRDDKERYDEGCDIRKVRAAGAAGKNHLVSECAMINK